MIIDIFGLPGSGKSYLADCITTDLEKSKIEVKNISRTERSLVGKLWYKLSCIYVKNMRTSMINKKKMKEILKDSNLKSGLYSPSIKLDNYIDRLVYLMWFYKKNKLKRKIYIFDEGFYQVLIAMCADFEIPLVQVEQLFHYSKKETKNILFLYNSISMEQCIESIQIRNRNVCDIDKLKADKLKQMLNDYEMLSKIIINKRKIVTLYRKDNMDQKINLVKTYIRNGETI